MQGVVGRAVLGRVEAVLEARVGRARVHRRVWVVGGRVAQRRAAAAARADAGGAAAAGVAARHYLRVARE